MSPTVALQPIYQFLASLPVSRAHCRPYRRGLVMRPQRASVPHIGPTAHLPVSRAHCRPYSRGLVMRPQRASVVHIDPIAHLPVPCVFAGVSRASVSALSPI